ncbi:putative membrane protein, partial [Vibrio parahaemolyticus V-223/04]
LSLSTSR